LGVVSTGEAPLSGELGVVEDVEGGGIEWCGGYETSLLSGYGPSCAR
jgi:hypothetical protein